MVRDYIKTNVLKMIDSNDKKISKAGSTCVSSIAIQELKNN